MTRYTTGDEQANPLVPVTMDDLDLLQSMKPGYGTRNVVESSLNIVNATVGAGVIGLPFALLLAGFTTGIALSVFVGLLTFAAMYSMILSGQRVGVYTFSALAEYGMGRFGFYMLNLMLFIQSAGSCVSYFILVADTLPVLFGLYLPQCHWLSDRKLATIIISVLFIFPLNLFRSIGALARWSALSVLLLPIMILSVLIRAPVYMPHHTAPLFSSGTDPIAALGIMSFAFVCSQVGFSNYLSQRNQSLQAWGITVSLATSLSWIISILFAAIGYLSFGKDVSPNIFSNFPADDHIINVGRLALGLSMVLTVPMGFYPARDALQKTLGFESKDRQPTAWQHYSMTVVLFAVFLVLGVQIHSLGKVYSVVGGVASSFLAYIIPGWAYLAVFRPSWIRFGAMPSTDELQPLIGADTKDYPKPTWWLDLATVVLVVFGTIVMTFTLWGAFR